MREEIYVPGSGTVNDITFKGGGMNTALNRIRLG